MTLAACRGVDTSLFFGDSSLENARNEKGRWRRVKLAKEICQSCPVQMNCLMWALNEQPHGIAGGMTDRERDKLRVMLEMGNWGDTRSSITTV